MGFLDELNQIDAQKAAGGAPAARKSFTEELDEIDALNDQIHANRGLAKQYPTFASEYGDTLPEQQRLAAELGALQKKDAARAANGQNVLQSLINLQPTEALKNARSAYLDLPAEVMRLAGQGAQLLSGGLVGGDTERFANEVQQDIRKDFDPTKLKLQRQLLENPADPLQAVLNNPGGAATVGAPSMAATLPLGVGVGSAMGRAALRAGVKSKQAGDIAASAANWANVGMNAAEGFSEQNQEGMNPLQNIIGTLIGAAVNRGLGRLTEGGAEGMLARALTTPGANKGRSLVRDVLKGAALGGADEVGDNLSIETGKSASKGEMPDITQTIKDSALDAYMGALTGGAGKAMSHAGTPVQDVPNREDMQQTILKYLGDYAQQLQGTSQPEAPQVQPEVPTEKQKSAANAVTEALKKMTREEQPAPVQPEPEETAGLTPTSARPESNPEVVLQNRDRTSAASVAQMNQIAANPDYGRTGPSRDFGNGAPVVAYGSVPENQLGRTDYATTADGERIPVQYAVVDADSVLTSNNINGQTNKDYAAAGEDRVRAIAGNGRVTGLAEAYRRGTAAKYREEMTADAAMSGVDPQVIQGMKSPILVRVMPKEKIRSDIGDISNTTGNMTMTATETAANDVNRLNFDNLTFDENGNFDERTVRDFVRQMPAAEQAGLIEEKSGRPTRQAFERLQNALFKKAYGNDDLVRLAAQAADPEVRNVISALTQTTPKLARLEGLGNLDLRELVTQAAEVAVNAKRQGVSLEKYGRQQDMTIDPAVATILRIFAENPRSVKDMVRFISDMADFAYTEGSKSDTDLFGSVPRATRADVLSRVDQELNDAAAEREATRRAKEALRRNDGGSPQTVEQSPGVRPAGENAAAATADGRGQGNAQPDQEGLTLTGETEAEAQANAAAKEKFEADEKKAREDAIAAEKAERLAKATKAGVDAAVDHFELTDDFTSDVDAVRGQKGLLFSKAGDRIKIKPESKEDADREEQVSGRTRSGQPGGLKFSRNPATGRPDIRLSVAYHGSPHVFDTFLTDHIGEGEGAQAHGWGLYFALEQETAEGYRNKLAAVEPEKAEAEYKVALQQKEAAEAYIREIESARSEDLRQMQKDGTSADDVAAYEKDFADEKAKADSDLASANARLKDAERARSRLYQVEIPDDDVMLREENYFDDQPEKVQEAVRKIFEERDSQYTPDNWYDDYDSLLQANGLDHMKGVADALYDFINAGRGEIKENLRRVIDVTFGLVEKDVADYYASRGLDPNDPNNPASAMQERVKRSIQKFNEDWMWEEHVPRINYQEMTGRDIYETIGDFFGSDKAASEQLSKKGVKGIRYDGFKDGECAVVFDDKAIKILSFWSKHQGAAHGGRTSEVTKTLSTDPQIGASFRTLTDAGAVNVVETVDDLPADIRSQIDDTEQSRSPMKSPRADIKRGLNAMARLIADHKTQYRAMFRPGLGWVDFEYGSEGSERIKGNGRRKGAEGILHIMEARYRKDGYNEKQIGDLLDDVVYAIADGRETSRQNRNGENLKVKVENFRNGKTTRVALAKTPSSDAWVVTGFHIDEPVATDVAGKGHGNAGATHLRPTHGRPQKGAVATDSVLILGNRVLTIKHSDNGDIQGVYDPASGKSYLIASNLSKDTAKGVFLHEVGVHMANDSAMAADMQPLIRRAVQIVLNGNSNGDATSREVYRRMKAAGVINDRGIIVEGQSEEALAYLVETVANNPEKVSHPIREWFGRLIGAVRRWLYRHGFADATRLSDKDLAAVAVSNVRALAQSKKTKGVKFSKNPDEQKPATEAIQNRLDNGNPVWGYPTQQDEMFGEKPDYVEDEDGTRRTYREFRRDEKRGLSNEAEVRADEQMRAGAVARGQKTPHNRLSDHSLVERDDFGNRKFGYGQWAYDHAAEATHLLFNAIDSKAGNHFNLNPLPPEFRKIYRDFKSSLDKSARDIQNVAKLMAEMPVAERRLVSDIIEKMVPSGVNPPEHIVHVAAAVSNLMDQQTDEMVRLGLLSKESAERWRGEYLPRIYLEQDGLLKQAKKEFEHVFSHAVRSTGMKGSHFKGRGRWRTVSGYKDIADHKSLGWEIRDPDWSETQGELEFVGEGQQPKVPTVVMWRDFTPEERRQMGEERDAMTRIVLGYMESQQDIALARFFQSVSEDSRFCGDIPQEGWVRVPQTTIGEHSPVKRYGALAGKYVSQEVWSQLERYSHDDWGMWYKTFLSAWKEGKTALNPVSHTNNVVGNVVMAHFAGVDAWNTPAYFRTFQSIYRNDERYKEAQDAGLFTGSWSRDELISLIPEDGVRDKLTGAQPSYQKLTNLFLNVTSLGLRKPLRWAYEHEDMIFKYLIYRDARDKGMNPRDAVDYANQFIFTYDDLPSGAKYIRDYAIPFFAWTYKAIPVLTRTALLYPHRFIAPAAIMFALNKAAYLAAVMAAGAADDWWEAWQKASELEDAEREALPDYAKGWTAFGTPKMIRLASNNDGTANFQDIARFMPGGDMMDFENQTGGLPWPQPFMPSHPALNLIAGLAWNIDTFTGKGVTKGEDDRHYWGKMAMFAWKNLTPALAPGGYHFNRVMNAIVAKTGTPVTVEPFFNYTGRDWQQREVELWRALLHTGGVKINPIDLDLAIQNRQREMVRHMKEDQSELRTEARKAAQGKITQESFERAREDILEDLRYRAEKLAEFTKKTEKLRRK